jgi:hypothetical protein
MTFSVKRRVEKHLLRITAYSKVAIGLSQGMGSLEDGIVMII